MTVERRVGTEGHTRHADQLVRPGGRDLLRGAECSPVLGKALDVRHLVGFVGRPQPVEPAVPRLGVRRRASDDGHQLLNRMVDRRPDRPGGAIDVLERRRDTLEKGHCPLGAEQWVAAGDPFDLRHRLLHALDGGLGSPAEGMPPKARLELPAVRVRSAHLPVTEPRQTASAAPACERGCKSEVLPGPRSRLALRWNSVSHAAGAVAALREVKPAARRSSSPSSRIRSGAPGSRRTFNSQVVKVMVFLCASRSLPASCCRHHRILLKGATSHAAA